MSYVFEKGIDLVDYDKHVIKHFETPTQAEFDRIYEALNRLNMASRFGIRYFVS